MVDSFYSTRFKKSACKKHTENRRNRTSAFGGGGAAVQTKLVVVTRPDDAGGARHTHDCVAVAPIVPSAPLVIIKPWLDLSTAHGFPLYGTFPLPTHPPVGGGGVGGIETDQTVESLPVAAGYGGRSSQSPSPVLIRRPTEECFYE